MEAVPARIDEVGAATTLREQPTVVLIAELSDADRGDVPPDQLEVLLRAKREQEDFAGASICARIVHVSGTSHSVQVDRPDVVVDAIREMLEPARGK